MKFIQPRLRAAAGKTSLAKSTRKQVSQKERDELKKSVFEMIAKAGPLAPMQIYTHLKVAPWLVKRAVDDLLKEKKIERISKGKGTKYKRR